ncbi:MAG TPA: ankyrin repeat domain-containing protein [Bryobacteraceae bacterium]|nr:ankyrin repeat domain-containing protein [Bryobacteraceae bacterium]
MRSFASFVIGAGYVFAGLLAAQTPNNIDFRRDIQPLFQEHCIGCHGPSQQMGGMRLDRRSSAMAIRGGTTIGPGNAAGSRLYLKLVGTKYGTRMPPTGPLPPEQINLVKTWIDQGADWPDDLSGDKASGPPDPRAMRIMEALRSGARQTLARLLREDTGAVNLKGTGGATPLMYAVLYGDAAVVRQLIDSGANANASNDVGATALMWAVDDPDKVLLLLEHGADANATSAENQTPLTIALASKAPAAVVNLLLDHGANADVKSYRGRNPFVAAGGDEALLRTLLQHGVDIARLSAGLSRALDAGCEACIQLLIKSASKPALNSGLFQAAGGRDARTLKILLDRGADANFADSGLGLTTLMYAAISEGAPLENSKTLIERDAEVNAKTADGTTALDFALRQGDQEVVKLLRQAGAKEGDASPKFILKPKPAPSVRAAIDRSLPLLQRSDVGFMKKSGCVSCHNNNLTAMTVAAARKQSVVIDDGVARAQRSAIAAYIEGNRERYLQGIPIAGGSDTAAYILLGLAAENWPPDPATDAMARYLKFRQSANGAWPTFGGRPPIESSDIQGTATALRAIQVYMPKAQRTEYDKSVQLAAEWLAQAQPKSTEDRAFQLFGLIWAGGNREIVRKAAGDLLKEQRSDGGWAQTSSLPSDAYATGQALVALKEAGVVTPADATYNRGARFLMNTQGEDGSWYVRSRSIPFQPYFESGFPYGPDQFISAAATNWAMMALLPLARYNPEEPR